MELGMNTLADKDVAEIAKQVATTNNVSFAEVRTMPVTDSTGAPAIEIKFLLTPGSSASIMGERSASTISGVIQRLFDEGEERVPIIRYEE
jgi:hypothetical protein